MWLGIGFEQVLRFSIKKMGIGTKNRRVWFQIKTRNFHPSSDKLDSISFEYMMMIVMYAINWMTVWTEPFVRHVKFVIIHVWCGNIHSIFSVELPLDDGSEKFESAKFGIETMNWKHKLRHRHHLRFDNFTIQETFPFGKPQWVGIKNEKTKQIS